MKAVDAISQEVKDTYETLGRARQIHHKANKSLFEAQRDNASRKVSMAYTKYLEAVDALKAAMNEGAEVSKRQMR